MQVIFAIISNDKTEKLWGLYATQELAKVAIAITYAKRPERKGEVKIVEMPVLDFADHF